MKNAYKKIGDLLDIISIDDNYIVNIIVSNGFFIHNIIDKKGRVRKFCLGRRATIKELEFLSYSSDLNNDIKYIMNSQVEENMDLYYG